MATRKTTRRRTTTPGKKITRRKKPSTRSVSMTKKQKDNLIMVGAAVGIGYLLLKGKGAKPTQMQASILPGSPSSGNYIPMDEPPPITAPGTSTVFPIGVGSSGNVVKSLQRALLKMGGTAAQYIRNTSMRSDGSVDGIFGQGTKNAVYAAGIRYPVSYSSLKSIL